MQADDRNPLNYGPPRNDLLGDLDSINRLALGPLYAPRDPNQLLAAGVGPARPAPIEISGGPIKGQVPIVRYRQDASAITNVLPSVRDGYTRIWRGNRPDEVGQAQQFTDDLAGIALPFREQYGGHVSYVDVPTGQLGQYASEFGVPGAEFWLPPNLASQAVAVPVVPRKP